MHRLRHGGFTLVELLVVIVILGTLLGLLLPAVNYNHPARGVVCRNNLRQLATALQSRTSSTGDFTGYINDVRMTENRRGRASWVIMILPYIDKHASWDLYQQGKLEISPFDIFACPSDPPINADQPSLSYVANAGYIQNANGIERKANGVFFDRTRTDEGAAGPEDERDIANSPQIVMTTKYLQAHDGASNTLLLAESIRPRLWGYSTVADQQTALDRKYHFGFCWEQPSVAVAPESTRRINGNWDYEEFTSFSNMAADDGFPSSNHPEIVNVAFADGSVRSLSQKIDPLVYAQLMTSNHLESDLVDSSGKPDSELVVPEESDY